MGATHARLLSGVVDVVAIADVNEELGRVLATEIGAEFVPDPDTLALRQDVDG